MISNEKVYCEVYAILNLLGEEYIKKLPAKLFALIEQNRFKEDIKFNNFEEVKESGVSKEAISMIALFHSNYWCDSDKEKQEIDNILVENFAKSEQKKREKYNPDNIFKDLDSNIEHRSDIVQDEVFLVKYQESFLKKIIKKIKNIFHLT